MRRDRPDYPLPERHPDRKREKSPRRWGWEKGIALLLVLALLFAAMDILFFNNVVRIGPRSSMAPSAKERAGLVIAGGAWRNVEPDLLTSRDTGHAPADVQDHPRSGKKLPAFVRPCQQFRWPDVRQWNWTDGTTT